MKLQHYIGGLEGLPEPLTLDRRVFAEEWERRIFGIHVAMMGLSGHLGSSVPAYAIADVPTTFRDMWTWADLRAGAEAMDPFDYFKFRYYEKWLGGITAFLVDKGYLREDELASRTTELRGEAAGPDVARLGGTDRGGAIDEQIMAYLRNGDTPRRDVAHPKFAVGRRVRITNVPGGAHWKVCWRSVASKLCSWVAPSRGWNRVSAAQSNPRCSKKVGGPYARNCTSPRRGFQSRFAGSRRYRSSTVILRTNTRVRASRQKRGYGLHRPRRPISRSSERSPPVQRRQPPLWAGGRRQGCRPPSVEVLSGPFLDFYDPWRNRVEVVGYENIQYSKAPNILRGTGLMRLAKNAQALKELAAKGMAPP